MKKISAFLFVAILSSLVVIPRPSSLAATRQSVPSNLQTTPSDALKPSMTKLETELVAKYGEAQRARLQRGMRQVASFWRAEDGDAAAFENLVRKNFAGDAATLDTMISGARMRLRELDW